MSDVALGLASITKRFGRTTALDAASMFARRGTVHALLGENGAGKTTLMRIAFGMLRSDSGTISVDDIVRSFASPGDAIASGIGMVHQHFTLVPAMTVTENISLGGHGLYHRRRARAAIIKLSDETGLPIDPDARINSLPAGAQQRVEILKALSHNTRVLILDEPTAVLTPVEARELLQVTRRLVQNGGTVILITHKLRDALEFADDITILRHGATVWTGRAADATEDALVEAMVGTERQLRLADNEMPRRASSGAMSARAGEKGENAVMVLNNVTVRDAAGVERLRSATLAIHGGEIVGVAGVEGNGQHELLRVLAGRIVPTAGEVITPAVVGFIPEDRQRDALIMNFSLRDNVAILGAGSRRGAIDWDAIGIRTQVLLRDYDVRARNDGIRAVALSGGNQQKFVAGREISGSHSALIAENPSRGLDVQAAAAIRRRIRAARDAGMAVVIYSSDLDEVLALADRVIVMYAGRVVEVTSEYEPIGRAMLGLSGR